MSVTLTTSFDSYPRRVSHRFSHSGSTETANAFPTSMRRYTVGPQKHIRTGPGAAGRWTSDFVYVSKSRIDPPERLVARHGRDDSPQLGTAVAAGQRPPDRAQAAPDSLDLTHDHLRIVLGKRRAGAVPQLAEPDERLPLPVPERQAVARRGQGGVGEGACLAQVVSPARERHGLDGNPSAPRQLLVGE